MLRIGDLKNEPNYAGWAKIEIWPIGVANELLARYLARTADLSEFDGFLLDRYNFVSQIIGLGIKNNELSIDKHFFNDIYSDKLVISYGNSMVNKDEYLRYAKRVGLQIPDDLWLSVKPEDSKEAKFRPEKETRLLCQGIAIALWDINPDMTIADMADQKVLLEEGGGKRYTEKVRRQWLSEVDPRPHEKKTGPKR